MRFWVPDYATAAEVVARAGDQPDLEVVQLQTAGYDGIPGLLPAGVTLCNGRGIHDDATAEHAVGLTLAVLRGVPEAVRAHGRWTDLSGRRSLADSRVRSRGEQTSAVTVRPCPCTYSAACRAMRRPASLSENPGIRP